MWTALALHADFILGSEECLDYEAGDWWGLECRQSVDFRRGMYVGSGLVREGDHSGSGAGQNGRLDILTRVQGAVSFRVC